MEKLLILVLITKLLQKKLVKVEEIKGDKLKIKSQSIRIRPRKVRY